MASATKICKVCGKEYKYCRTLLDPGIFRWQDVACCREHGSEYLAQVMKSRGETDTTPVESDATNDSTKQKPARVNSKSTVVNEKTE